MKSPFKFVNGDFDSGEDLAEALMKAGGPTPADMKHLKRLGSGPNAQRVYSIYGEDEEDFEQTCLLEAAREQQQRQHVFVDHALRRRRTS